MQSDAQINQALNRILGHYLISINQYFLHARMLNNWGIKALGQALYHYSIEDMKEADELIKRLFLLEGLPNLQALGKLLVGENTGEIIHCDLQGEISKRESLTKGIAICNDLSDFVSRDLLETLLEKTEDKIDWLEAQEDLIEQLGIENYIQTNI